jgi:hemerythrin-like domain-containing protein
MDKNASQDAISLLQKDHEEMKNGFKKYEGIGDKALDEKKALAERLCAMFMQHAVAEEEIFYPAIREKVGDSRDMINEALVEHASAKELVAQIQVMMPGEELYDAKIKVLGELIEHHIKEEESEMFEKAKSAQLDMAKLGEMIDARKQQLAGDRG